MYNSHKVKKDSSLFKGMIYYYTTIEKKKKGSIKRIIALVECESRYMC